VLGPQRVGQPLERGGQALVGGDQVGPSGVAADAGDDVGPQDGGEGRVDRGRDVGVPADERVGAVVVLADLVAVALDQALDVDRVDLREPFGRAVVVGVGVGQLAEVAPEADLAGMVEPLAPEEEHAVAQQCGPDGGHGVVVEGLRDVEAVDLGPDLARDRSDVEQCGFEQVGHESDC
jgi:hypothetical protein